jgi:DNA-directed RNA polymerase alpha subunit
MASRKERTIEKKQKAQTIRHLKRPELVQKPKPVIKSSSDQPHEKISKETKTEDKASRIKKALNIVLYHNYIWVTRFGISEKTLRLLVDQRQIHYLGQLVQMSDRDILSVRYMGPVSLYDLKRCEAEFPAGVTFGMDVKDWTPPGN